VDSVENGNRGHASPERLLIKWASLRFIGL
jgi:hypothetical protein